MLTSHEMSYGYAAWKFAYHFLKKQSAEWLALKAVIQASHPEHVNALYALKANLRDDVYTEPRTLAAITKVGGEREWNREKRRENRENREKESGENR